MNKPHGPIWNGLKINLERASETVRSTSSWQAPRSASHLRRAVGERIVKFRGHGLDAANLTSPAIRFVYIALPRGVLQYAPITDHLYYDGAPITDT